MAKLILFTSTIVGYAYLTEFYIAFYSANPFEEHQFIWRIKGDYAWAFWMMFSCNVFIPALLWVKKIRRNILVLWVISIFVNIGMWFERFVITVTSLHRDFLPSSWGYFTPTWVDVLTFVGSFGLFLTLFLLFLRFLPMVALAEVKGVVPEADPHFYDEHEAEHDVPYVQPAQETDRDTES
jgi:molybdopterin-containing oxidoreductase family membrane subunit